ncbi:unnamed protein product [Sphagnum jensenii]|jgi:hypothetical protein|uniref:GOST seven transmembrane domain-containing protein n=1 Tax=Sphagnum jensenii TaxID=128206 RepID=A0ABP0VN84_9BRYO
MRWAMWGSKDAAVLCTVLLWWISGVLQLDASLHKYNHAQFKSEGNSYIYWGGYEGLHASATKTRGQGTADGTSYIKIDNVKFTRTQAAVNRNVSDIVEAIIVDVASKGNIGDHGPFTGNFELCCTKDMAIQTGCSPGEVIIRPDHATGLPKSFKVKFSESDTSATMSENVNITKTGMYTLIFVACEPELDGLVIDGMTIWKNPTGYLPGRMAAFISFYAFMSLAYGLLGLLWFFQYVRHWKDILQLQNCISAVIALGMSEMAVWYFEYLNFNGTGMRPMAITMWAVTLGAVKKTVSRLLILVVSMGYGVVRPTLGGLTSKVMLLGGTYFLAAESLDVVENVGTINDPPGKERLFLVLPVAMLDAFFILWIFTSLSKTLERLQARRRFAKLELYRRFTNSLAVAVVVSVLWIGYELYFKATDEFGERWQSYWIIHAFWSGLSFALLVVICILWAPSQNSTRYAYSEDVGEEDLDEEAVALTSGVAGKSTVVVETEKNGAKPDVKERKPISTDVFSLEDDLEEDKRD